MQIDKTVVFTVDDKRIIIADLQDSLRKQFEIFDAYRQELADLAIKYEMASTAVKVKELQLQEIVRQVMAPAKPPEAEVPVANE